MNSHISKMFLRNGNIRDTTQQAFSWLIMLLLHSALIVFIAAYNVDSCRDASFILCKTEKLHIDKHGEGRAHHFD